MTLRLATVSGDPEEEGRLAAELSGRSGIELIMRCVDRVEVLAVARARSVDALVMAGVAGWFDQELAYELDRTGVKLLASARDPLEAEQLTVLGAMLVRRGASADELVTALSVETPQQPPIKIPSGGGSGKVVSVWGPKGAPGRTTIAVELAHAFAMRDPSTILVDGDPYGGDVVQLLGIVEDLPTVVWAARRAARGETAQVMADLRRAGESGPIVLPGLPRPEFWADVSEHGWTELLEALRGSFDNVVVDTGFCLEAGEDLLSAGAQGRNRMTRIALRTSDRVVVIFKADPVGIKNLIRDLTELEQLVDPDRFLFAANRVRRGQEGDIADLLKRHVGRRPAVYVPESVAETAHSMSSGRTVRESDPGSDLVRSIDVMAEALGARVPPRGFLTRLAGKA